MNTPASWLDEVLASIRQVDEHARLATGEPPAGEGGWARFEGYALPGVQDLVFAREQARANGPIDTPLTVRGTYLWQNLVGPAPRLAGYLFTTQRRVPVLRDNVRVRNIEWMQHQRIVRPQAVVLPDDPLAGTPGIEVAGDLDALTDRLWEEVAALVAPVLPSFRARRFVGTANGWGLLLDGLAGGVAFAGRIDAPGVDADEAWARWEAALEARFLPTRHRPRRFEPGCEGGCQSGSMLVRAGCCLWFTTPRAARYEGQDYCHSCRLMPDAERTALHVRLGHTAGAGSD